MWDIPNVKAGHIEKTEHPCQFPTALVRRLILALCPQGGLVIDPYMGSGTTALTALMHNRNFSGSELEPEYFSLAKSRLAQLEDGSVRVREDKPVREPKAGESVSIIPDHFRLAGGIE